MDSRLRNYRNYKKPISYLLLPISYIDVIPSEHSIGIHPLTYSVAEDFEGEVIPGCIVEIPVRSATEYGIVVGFREYPPEHMELRDIIGLITNKEVLAPYQIALILEISAKYLIPIHRVLGFFLPKPVIKRLEKKNFEQLDGKTHTHNQLAHHTSAIETSSVEMTKNQITILKDSIITGEILKPYIKEGTIILCPDDFTLYRLQRELSGRDDIFYIPNESTETKKAQSWIDIYSKKYPIIVGNRKILYYNLGAYTNILYLEDAFGREYFHYPIRIEYIDIFDMFDKQQRFSLRILTSVPRLTTLTQFRHFHTAYI